MSSGLAVIYTCAIKFQISTERSVRKHRKHASLYHHKINRCHNNKGKRQNDRKDRPYEPTIGVGDLIESHIHGTKMGIIVESMPP